MDAALRIQIAVARLDLWLTEFMLHGGEAVLWAVVFGLGIATIILNMHWNGRR